MLSVMDFHLCLTSSCDSHPVPAAVLVCINDLEGQIEPLFLYFFSLEPAWCFENIHYIPFLLQRF